MAMGDSGVELGDVIGGDGNQLESSRKVHVKVY